MSGAFDIAGKASPVTSPAHPVVKLARELGNPKGRKRRGLVLVEGLRAAETAAAAGARAEAILFTHAALAEPRGQALAARLAKQGVPVHVLGAGLYRSLTQVETPQGVGLICAPPQLTLGQALGFAFVVVADRLQDPGNLGNLLRSARAFGVEAVVTTKGSTEAANPKAIRAAAGAWPGLPLAEHVPAETLGPELKARGFAVLIADPHGGRDFREPVWQGRVALVLGSES
ncbi:MAG: RNA methyltransferase, partial [bacterium]